MSTRSSSKTYEPTTRVRVAPSPNGVERPANVGSTSQPDRMRAERSRAQDVIRRKVFTFSVLGPCRPSCLRSLRVFPSVRGQPLTRSAMRCTRTHRARMRSSLRGRGEDARTADHRHRGDGRAKADKVVRAPGQIPRGGALHHHSDHHLGPRRQAV
jgi:hypothetical protein